MALAEIKVPSGLWTIDGLDVSRRGLEKARRGWYRESSFRETSPRLWQQYFRRVEDGWEIDAALRAVVRFSIGNLVDSHLLAGAEPFDLILCRNLLIYHHPAAREQSLATLDRLLAPQGLLAMGHAEPLSLVERRFQPFGPSGCFLFRRAEPPGSKPPPLRDGNGTPQALALSPSPFSPLKQELDEEDRHRLEKRSGPKPEKEFTKVATPTPGSEPDPLAQARGQADSGLLEEALASCQAHLAGAAHSADLYALMGVIRSGPARKGASTWLFS